jgi:hypothetical protein
MIKRQGTSVWPSTRPKVVILVTTGVPPSRCSALRSGSTGLDGADQAIFLDKSGGIVLKPR